jgi:hypothetical protein
MARDGVKKVANEIWKWGKFNRPGYAIHVLEEQLYLDLMERGEVSCRKGHIYFKGKGLHYNCAWIQANGFQDRIDTGKLKTFKCRYHRGLVDFILVETSDGLKTAYLDNKDKMFRGLSFSEVAEFQANNKEANSELKEQALIQRVSADMFLKERLKQANREARPAPVGDIQQIRKNRQFEMIHEQQRQLVRLLDSVALSNDISIEELQDEDTESHANRAAFSQL